MESLSLRGLETHDTSETRSLKGQRIVYGHSFSILGAKSFRIATGKELVNSYSPASLPGTKAVITPKKRSSM